MVTQKGPGDRADYRVRERFVQHDDRFLDPFHVRRGVRPAFLGMSIAEQYCTPRAAGDSRRSSASLCPALLQLLPPAVALNQHILGISKLLLPLIAQAAEVLSSRSASRSTSSKLTSGGFSSAVNRTDVAVQSISKLFVSLRTRHRRLCRGSGSRRDMRRRFEPARQTALELKPHHCAMAKPR